MLKKSCICFYSAPDSSAHHGMHIPLSVPDGIPLSVPDGSSAHHGMHLHHRVCLATNSLVSLKYSSRIMFALITPVDSEKKHVLVSFKGSRMMLLPSGWTCIFFKDKSGVVRMYFFPWG